MVTSKSFRCEIRQRCENRRQENHNIHQSRLAILLVSKKMRTILESSCFEFSSCLSSFVVTICVDFQNFFQIIYKGWNSYIYFFLTKWFRLQGWSTFLSLIVSFIDTEKVEGFESKYVFEHYKI